MKSAEERDQKGSNFPLAVMRLWQNEGRSVRLKVQGKSMEPLIAPGDTITLRLMPADELKKGDIFGFLRDGCVIVHRLITKRKDHNRWLYGQKGDNLASLDWVTEEEILGRIDSVHGAARTIRLDNAPWTWFNPAIAHAFGLWMFFFQKIQRLKLREEVAVVFSLNKLRGRWIRRAHGNKK